MISICAKLSSPNIAESSQNEQSPKCSALIGWIWYLYDRWIRARWSEGYNVDLIGVLKPKELCDLHASSFTGVSKGWLQPASHRSSTFNIYLDWVRELRQHPREFASGSPPGCCRSSNFCLANSSCSSLPAAWPPNHKRWSGSLDRSLRSLACVHCWEESPILANRIPCRFC